MTKRPTSYRLSNETKRQLARLAQKYGETITDTITRLAAERHAAEYGDGMDMQTYLQNAVQAERTKNFGLSDQLSLGELIAKLEPIAEKQAVRLANEQDEAIVYFDFGDLFPTEFTSWRGIYRELALCFSERWYSPKDVKPHTVTGFLKLCKETVGKEFIGYKGGEFTMGKNTPVWVANWGTSGNTALLDVVDDGYTVILITGFRES